jgi:hypothetical protein
MSKGDYNRALVHREKLRAKKERLDGLRGLYATYEQAGHRPRPGTYMQSLRKRISSVQNQLRAMAYSDEEEP